MFTILLIKKTIIYDKISQYFVGGVIALTLTACTTDSVFEDLDHRFSFLRISVNTQHYLFN